MNPESLNFDTLASILVVSNTPDYLFRHFSREPSVVELGKEPAEELLDAAAETAKRTPRSLNDRVQIYAALVAAANKPSESKAWLQEHDIPPVRWATEILLRNKTQHGGTTYVDHSSWPKPIIVQVNGGASGGVSNTKPQIVPGNQHD